MKPICALIFSFFILILQSGCSRLEPYRSNGHRAAAYIQDEPGNTGKESTGLFVPDPVKNNCLNCHQGIEPIRDPASGMMQAIYKLAAKTGHPDNDCIVCHGGNPEGISAVDAHKGTHPYFETHRGPKDFYPNPSSVWINQHTCGMCHKEQVGTQFTSLMFTEAGKIQGTTWGFGGLQGYEHNVANMAVEEPAYHRQLGSAVYKKYMQKLREQEPQAFPTAMSALPEAPTLREVAENPRLAVYTYLRAECQRCHTGVKGHNAYGDYRGAGCASCHIPYSNKGLYEGNDPTINRKKPGKLLVHTIQATRDAKVHLHGRQYSGIPTKTCTACHNRGRRIGVSYEGLMETAYSSPFMSNGDPQQKLHKKNYIHLQSDVHLKKGMVCQDCHTSGDLHSTGFLTGAIQGAVEIECQDCHGTTNQYPWELPIGYGDEITGPVPRTGEPRGVADTVAGYLKKGWVAPKHDGYLITARGNPMNNVVKDGKELILYSAGGKDIRFKPLKTLADKNELSLEGKVAMSQVGAHMSNLECYACHATWAPQCYGCHVEIDYTDLNKKLDWVAVAKSHNDRSISTETMDAVNNFLISGKITEQRSYLRWEDPPLVVNGEHRVSPAIPGCQTTVSVKGPDGKMLLLNHIFRIPHAEGSGDKGQLAIDMAPLFPHTTQKEARKCESCHTNPKSMGYGISEGKLYSDPSKNVVMDLTDTHGNPIPKQYDTLFNAIPNLTMDWSRIIDDSNRQLQTVGHHFSGSRPLNKDELTKLDRRGVCLSCHKTVPESDLASGLLSHVAKYGGQTIDKNTHAGILNKSIRISAWVQVLLPFLIIAFILFRFLKKRKRLPRDS